jgi:Ca2+-binding RTX toxin-like protein
MTATENDDTIYGSSSNDGISGLGGNDTLYGRDQTQGTFDEDGSDLIDGGEGNDTLFGGTGNDVVLGGKGDDVLHGGPNKHYNGEYVYGDGPGGYVDGETHTPADVLDGGEGNDWAFVTYAGVINLETNEQLAITLDMSHDGAMVSIDGTYYGELLKSIEKLTFTSGDKADYLIATDGDDDITTNDGDDHIEARGGNDIVKKGLGALDIDAGDGTDTLWLDRSGDAGALSFDVGTGIFRIDGMDMGEAMHFESLVYIGAEHGNDVTGALDGSNELTGGAGADTLTGGNIADTITGSSGNDLLTGLDGADTITGGKGKDQILAGNGDDDVSIVVDGEFEKGETYDGGADIDTLHVDFFGKSKWNLSGAAIRGFEKLEIDNYPFSPSYSVKIGTAQLLGFKEIDLSFDPNDHLVLQMADKSKLAFNGEVLAFRTLQLANGGQVADFRHATGSTTGPVNVFPEVLGGTGNDIIFGRNQKGLDFFAHGGKGKDTLTAAASNSVLDGGAGNDVLTGGKGADDFKFDTALDARTNVDLIRGLPARYRRYPPVAEPVCRDRRQSRSQRTAVRRQGGRQERLSDLRQEIRRTVLRSGWLGQEVRGNRIRRPRQQAENRCRRFRPVLTRISSWMRLRSRWQLSYELARPSRTKAEEDP